MGWWRRRRWWWCLRTHPPPAVSVAIAIRLPVAVLVGPLRRRRFVVVVAVPCGTARWWWWREWMQPPPSAYALVVPVVVCLDCWRCVRLVACTTGPTCAMRLLSGLCLGVQYCILVSLFPLSLSSDTTRACSPQPAATTRLLICGHLVFGKPRHVDLPEAVQSRERSGGVDSSNVGLGLNIWLKIFKDAFRNINCGRGYERRERQFHH
jgi:hypothetical protein